MTRGLGTTLALSLLAHGGAVTAVGVLGIAWLGGSPPAPAPAPLFVDLVQPLVSTNDRVASGDAPPARRPARASPIASSGPAAAKPPTDVSVPAPAAAAGPSVSESAPRPSAGPAPTTQEISPPPAPPPPAAPAAPEPHRAAAEPAATAVASIPAGSGPAPSSAPPASVPVPAIAEPARGDPAAGVPSRALPPSPVQPAAPGEAAPTHPWTATLVSPDADQGALVAAHADRASPIPSPVSPAGGGAPTGAGAADSGSVARVAPGETQSPGHDGTRPVNGDTSAHDGSIGGGAIPPEYEPYLRALRQRVQDRLVYPWVAVRRGQHGVVELEVRLGPEGRLVGVEVLAGAPAESLRAAAVTAVRGAAPFPFPPGLQGRALIIRLPVEFRLR